MGKVIGALFGPERLSYREILVWLTGTGIFLATDKLTAEQWLILSVGFLGGSAIGKLRTPAA